MNSLIIYLLLFYLVYTPNVGIFFDESILLSKYSLLPVIFIILIFINVKRIKQIKKIFINKSLIYFFLGIVISAIYFIVIALINDHTSFFELRIVQNIFIIVQISTLLLFLNYLKKNKNYSYEGLLKLIFKVAMIQFVISILMYFVPSLKNIANTLYFGLTEPSKNMIYASSIRIFGISEEYTFLTQVYHGFLASLAFLLGNIKDKKYYIYIPICLLLCVLNGRLGIIIFLVNYLIIVFGLLVFSKDKKSILFKALVPMLIIIMLYGLLLLIKPSSVNFVNSAFKSIIDLIFHGKATGNLNTLLKKHLFFPSGLKLFFGCGHRVFGLSNGSDIGYVNDIFMGGIVFALLIYINILIYFIKTRKENKLLNIWTFMAISTLFITNFKGECMRAGILLVMLVVINEVISKIKLNKPLVSIIMSTYNTRKSYLKCAIDSILKQSYKNIEFIIICDGNEEEYKYIKNNYNDCRIKLLLHEKNFGLAKSLNDGIKISKGKYIARMDSDDISLKNRIETQVNYLEENNSIDICSMYAQSFGNSRDVLNTYFNDSESIDVQLSYESCIVHPTVMFRSKYLLENEINYDESYKCSQDFELWNRIRNNNIYVIPSFGLLYRVHNKQITYQKRNIQIEMVNNIIDREIRTKKYKNSSDMKYLLLKFSGVEKLNEEDCYKTSKIIDEYFVEQNCNNIVKKIYYNKFFKRIVNDNILKLKIFDIIKEKNIRKKVFNFTNFKFIIFILLIKFEGKIILLLNKAKIKNSD